MTKTRLCCREMVNDMFRLLYYKVIEYITYNVQINFIKVHIPNNNLRHDSNQSSLTEILTPAVLTVRDNLYRALRSTYAL